MYWTYPAQLNESHLRVIPNFRQQLHCLIGFSDHTAELINPVAATAIGVCVYEKHFTLDKALAGPDHRMSLDPQELKATVNAIRQTEQALGSNYKQVLESEKENRTKLRKSLVAAIDIEQGSVVTKSMLTAKRLEVVFPQINFTSI